ncbi:hypothetical protein NJ56_16570 [Yersinia ruckeri]|nr:hypothetical protein NJ56_16570 [Yersinia ruckeri]PHZ21284.1 hypothetical protein CS534_02045 [Yersinia ruckeri]
MAGKWDQICGRKFRNCPLLKALFFRKKHRLTEIMRPYAGDNREVDGFARRLGVIGLSGHEVILPAVLTPM